MLDGRDPAIEHFRKASVVSDFDHLDAVIRQQLGGAASRKNFHTETGQRLGKRQNARFVGNTDEGTLNFGRHGNASLSLLKDRKWGSLSPGHIP